MKIIFVFSLRLIKYVDDVTLLEATNLKRVLMPNPDPTRPLIYRERTNHILLPNHQTKMQVQLGELEQFTLDNEMKINQDKSKVMIFNNARTVDFMPDMRLCGGELEVVDEMRLLGLVVTSDLSWNQNTENICKNLRELGHTKLVKKVSWSRGV